MFWPDFAAKALLLVIPTELEIFDQILLQKLYLWSLLQNKKYWLGFAAKALLLVTPTELEIYFLGEALVLVNPDPSPREAFDSFKPLPNGKFF